MAELDDMLGHMADDTATGCRGRVTGYAVYATGEPRVLIEGTDSAGRPFRHCCERSRVRMVGGWTLGCEQEEA